MATSFPPSESADDSVLSKIDQTLARSRKVIQESIEITRKTQAARLPKGSFENSFELAGRLTLPVSPYEVNPTTEESENTPPPDFTQPTLIAELKAQITTAHEEIGLLLQRRASSSLAYPSASRSTNPSTDLTTELASLKSQYPRVHKLERALERLRSRYEVQCKTNNALKQRIKQVYEDRVASSPHSHLKHQMKANCCKIQELELRLQTTNQQLHDLKSKAKLSRASGSAKRLHKVRRNSRRGIR